MVLRNKIILEVLAQRFCTNRRNLLIISFITTITIFFIFSSQNRIEKNNETIYKGNSATNNNLMTGNYLINTSTCKIPNLDPFNDDVKPYFRKEFYSKCSEHGLLTFINKTIDFDSVLTVNKSIVEFYADEIDCCFKYIERIDKDNNSDSDIRLLEPCIPFVDQVTLSQPIVHVTCKNSEGYQLYENVHATALPNFQQKQNLHQMRSQRPYSILLVGIDSISKSNLIRTMPKTYYHLEKNFVNLKGYNKIADNTFPNLMAILTGLSRTQINTVCDPDKNPMENCDFLWKKLSKLGYTTGYGEDECSISTFNYANWGFRKPPTDFYYRPYMLAAEKLTKQIRNSMTYCAGPETSAERILNLAKDFSITFQNVPAFSLFWINSVSHENINAPAEMDEKVMEFLSNPKFLESLNRTMFVFFSDHGFRFGDIRYTHSGWLEERLPYIYLYLPKDFQIRYSKLYDNLLVNSKRLTTPYDLYVTLQNLVVITGDIKEQIKPSKACKKCQSLFGEVPENRTCEDASIEQHWCTCKMHKYISPTDQVAENVASFVTNEINLYLRSFLDEGHFCSSYTLNRVISAGRSESYQTRSNETANYFLVIFETIPSAMFEATVEVLKFSGDMNRQFKLLGDISRINKYSGSSYCVKTKAIKKYCYCDGIATKLKSALCTLFKICL